MPENNPETLGLVAVQVLSSDNSRLLTSRETHIEVAQALQGEWRLEWLPPMVRDRSAFVAGASEATTILAYVLGISILSLTKPFFQKVAEEAGKDFWSGIKNLVSKLHAKQAKESYNLQSTIYVVFELNDEHVAIEFRLSGDSIDTTDEQVEMEVIRLIGELGDSWDEIHETIKKFQVGDRSSRIHDSNERHVHVIRRFSEHGKHPWNIFPESTTSFFVRVRPRDEDRRR